MEADINTLTGFNWLGIESSGGLYCDDSEPQVSTTEGRFGFGSTSVKFIRQVSCAVELTLQFNKL
jgi:hypothetical protein